jgi:hypothetical protein
MSIFKNKIVDFLDIASSNISINANISANHNKTIDVFNNINLLYGESSVSEDIALNGFLSTYNSAKSIVSNNANNIVIESFLSKDNFDQSFPLDKQLNIDIQNGDLTLPVLSTTDIPVASIIIENDSNGFISSSNGDIRSILSGDSSSLFKYEKTANNLSISDLYLTLTLKVDQSDVVNGLYIQLYADDGTKYPVVEMVEYSMDGQLWNHVDYAYDTNKADHYIRFSPEYTSLVRVRFKQSTYTSTQTGFGIRFNYSVGIRQITLKKTSFDVSGEYITIPLQSSKIISSVSFSSLDNGGVNYFLSANNGTKLIPIKNLEDIKVYNSQFGIRDDADISSIRVKILMDKSNVSIDNVLTREYSTISSSGKYYLSKTPNDTKMFIGKHISFGDMSPYILMPKDISKVDSSILEENSGIYGTINLYYVPFYDGIVDDIVITANGAKVKNDRAIYNIVPHSAANHSVLEIKNIKLTDNANTLALFYKPVVSNIQEIVLPIKPFTKTKDGFTVVRDDGQEKIQLENVDFEIIENDTATAVFINDSAYSKLSTYYISFNPQVDISGSLPSNIIKNEISVQSIISVPKSQLCFEYTYENKSDSYKKQFFTQICKEFRVELK